MSFDPLGSQNNEAPSFWERALTFFFPDLCAACKTPGYRNLCPKCHAVMEEAFDPKTFLCYGGNGYADAMLALFPYDCKPVKKIIFSWKRDSFPEFSAVFSHYLERAVKKRSFYHGIDLITYVPRQNLSRFLIGFDQAEKLGKVTADVLGLPLEPLLLRKSFRPPQHKLPAERRIQNVSGVFSPARTLQGETILLVDDVVTGGSSARECARILKKAGAQKVYVLSFAHPQAKTKKSKTE